MAQKSSSMSMSSPTLIGIIIASVVAVIAIALGGAYMAGYLDPLIEQLGIYFLKAKGKAEEKKLQAQGLKEGQDFMKGELKGNQQADQVASSFGGGGLDSLKKGL